METKQIVIRPAKSAHLLSIMYLVRECVREMNTRGFYHWNTFYPGLKHIEWDIENKTLYIVKSSGYIIGIFTLDKNLIEEYMEVTWSGDPAKAVVLKRFAIHPEWRNTGVEQKILEFVEEEAKKSGFVSILFDVAKNDDYNRKIFKEAQYQEKGEFLMNYQKRLFSGFQKEI